jgi:carboxyl-terminal processing protease
MAALLATTILATPLTIEESSASPSSPASTWSSLQVLASERNQPPRFSIVRSQALALTEQQLLVDDVWREVTRQFVDRTFNGLGEEGWRKRRLEAVTKVGNVGPDDKEIVYAAIRNMLASLGDPYTRFLTPEQFESMTSYARGSSSKAGIGVQLVGDPATGRIVIANTIQEGPAAKGGILSGDIVVEVDFMNVEGATAEAVAARCRGESGTEVALAVRHGGDGRPDDSITRISVKRSQIKSSSVESFTFVSENDKKVGYIKISSFNQETEKLVMEALNVIRRTRTSAVVVDLRGNVGGYMPAGVNVAKLFLPPKTRVISEVDKSGRVTIYINDGVGSDTDAPLYLLVDKRTASASEILTAALQDNHRATVVGTRTFGKGRIQNIQELQDGSGIAVTKAKYITPDGRDIHGVGITPDVESKTCGPEDGPEDCLRGLI